jgi:hypothetical protein
VRYGGEAAFMFLFVLLAAIAVAGCGSSSKAGSSSPRQQVVQYLAAFKRGDGKAACALLTPQARANVPSLSEKLAATDCEGAIKELSQLSEPLRAPTITIRRQGDQAVARIRNRRPPYQSDVLLDNTGGGWQIAYPPALLERYKSPPGIRSDPNSSG